jgi:hypothetical protein
VHQSFFISFLFQNVVHISLLRDSSLLVFISVVLFHGLCFLRAGWRLVVSNKRMLYFFIAALIVSTQIEASLLTRCMLPNFKYCRMVLVK